MPEEKKMRPGAMVDKWNTKREAYLKSIELVESLRLEVNNIADELQSKFGISLQRFVPMSQQQESWTPSEAELEQGPVVMPPQTMSVADIRADAAIPGASEENFALGIASTLNNLTRFLSP